MGPFIYRTPIGGAAREHRANARGRAQGSGWMDLPSPSSPTECPHTLPKPPDLAPPPPLPPPTCLLSLAGNRRAAGRGGGGEGLGIYGNLARVQGGGDKAQVAAPCMDPLGSQRAR